MNLNTHMKLSMNKNGNENAEQHFGHKEANETVFFVRKILSRTRKPHHQRSSLEILMNTSCTRRKKKRKRKKNKYSVDPIQ